MSRWLFTNNVFLFPVNSRCRSHLRCPKSVHAFIRACSSACPDSTTEWRWESCRKKKVALRVGYTGTDYRGLQLQRFDSLPTIEAELESAIYKAGGIRDSNYGDLQKIKWARSSRTDKGVHSMATVITLKMEIPEDAWKNDPTGTVLATHVNYHLPKNIKVFSILPSRRSFDARRQCDFRMYSYFIPAEIIGIKNDCRPEEVAGHLNDFNDILRLFEGGHPFHNFTSRSRYRKPIRQKHIRKTISSVDKLDLLIEETDGDEYVEQGVNPDSSNNHQNQAANPVMKARWLYEPDEMDRLSSSHFRKVLRCSCGMLQTLSGVNFVELSIHGESFMLHQIRKMVGTAVAVKRKLLPRDIILLSLAKFSRIILPVTPPEVLMLRDNQFTIRDCPGNTGSSPEVSEVIQNEVDEFYRSVLLPHLLKFLDPSDSPWTEWMHNLESGVAISDDELDEVRSAWREYLSKAKGKRSDGWVFRGNVA